MLSSTLPEFSGGPPFAVFDGTSMAAPHVTGAAALLVQLHPGWSTQQVKSALMSTAAPAWADTARLHEAPVTLGGAGLVDLPSAAQPVLFTQPSSLSYADLDVNHGSDSKALLVRVTDAGGGSRNLAGRARAAGRDCRSVARHACRIDGRARWRGGSRRRCTGEGRRGGGRGLRVHPAAPRRGDAQDPVRVLRRAPTGRADAGEEARPLPTRRHDQRNEPHHELLLPGRAVRPFPGLPRPGDGRVGRGDDLRDEHQPAGREPRRGDRVVRPRARWSTPGSSARRTNATCRGTQARR